LSDLTIGAKPIRQPDEKSFAAAVRITLAIFVLATPFFLYMGLAAANMQEEYRLSRLVEGRRQMMKENERLLLTRDALRSPGTVNAIAREKLGMVEEDAQEWTVGVAPEQGRAGEPGSRGAGEKKEKPRDLGSRTPGGNQEEKKPANEGRGDDAGIKASIKLAPDPKMTNTPRKNGPSVRIASTPVGPPPAPKAPASGRVTDAVSRPKPSGGPGKPSAIATPPRAHGGTR
jgi:cell division protein FtsL